MLSTVGVLLSICVLALALLFSSDKWLSDWSVEKCAEWYKTDPGVPTDILPCPPTLQQAETDVRFVRSETLLAFYHPGAEAGFRQREATGSGAGQQCVYKSGRVLVGPPGGGTADLYTPSGMRGVVFHLKHDVWPWVICCKLNNHAPSCFKYYEKRPSDSGQRYTNN